MNMRAICFASAFLTFAACSSQRAADAPAESPAQPPAEAAPPMSSGPAGGMYEGERMQQSERMGQQGGHMEPRHGMGAGRHMAPGERMPVAGQECFCAGGGPHCEEHFAHMDADADGDLTQEEFSKMHPGAHAPDMFTARDQNGDGKLTADELCAEKGPAKGPAVPQSPPSE